MTSEILSPSPGIVRVRLQSLEGRWFTVGPLLTLSGARVFAEDMLAESPQSVKAVRVEHRQGKHLAPCVDLPGRRTVSPRRPSGDDMDRARGTIWGSLIGAAVWLALLLILRVSAAAAGDGSDLMSPPPVPTSTTPHGFIY
jgi:hypothetical protein